ncbi:MAG TPA: MaoC family dehydratase N-terminal domain-containing protein [Pseudonocardia sp.]|nr:MaoC family dehydratase N-terminal domain-containing protein [Pseudonocardia sp.]
MEDDLSACVEGWRPAPVETTGRLDPWPVEAFAALLDQPAPVGELPPLWHWLHLLDHPGQRELGDDGHPVAGAFLPPIPDRRRMFAGGRLTVRSPLPIGEEVVRRSSVVEVAPKSGRSGAMVFVTVRHELLRDGEVAVVEEQDLAYRSQVAGTARGLPAELPVVGEHTPGRWHLRLDPTPALLFRFSALTYNAHRIHYDAPYVTEVEGYPGLVVHGPLLALLMLELPRRHAPDVGIERFEFRLRRPAFAGVPVVVDGDPGSDRDGELTAAVPGQPPSATGRFAEAGR